MAWRGPKLTRDCDRALEARHRSASRRCPTPITTSAIRRFQPRFGRQANAETGKAGEQGFPREYSSPEKDIRVWAVLVVIFPDFSAVSLFYFASSPFFRRRVAETAKTVKTLKHMHFAVAKTSARAAVTCRQDRRIRPGRIDAPP